MKFKIIVDSSSNLVENYIKDEDIGFEVVPLTLRIDDKEFIDDKNLDTLEMLNDISKAKVCKSSCPSTQAFLDAYEGADYVFAVTISSKLSGCFNSAMAAKVMSENEQNIAVIDSKATAGSMVLLVDMIVKLIKEGKEFDEIVIKANEYRDNYSLLFALDCFDNLVRNGRLSKIQAFIANLARIRPLCCADDGEIKIKEKIRTFKGVLTRIVANIGKMRAITKGFKCIIAHTNNKKVAEELKTQIQERYEFEEVRVMENRGLCVFYSLQNGIIVSF